MSGDQRRAPLIEALQKFMGSSPRRFHVPGHNGGRGAPEDLLALLGTAVFDMDITELPGMDDLNNPVGVIAEAQELASLAFGADRTFFLVNGTTLGLQALLLAVGRPGKKVILPRNVHRSIVGGLVLAGMDPVFMTPAVVPGFAFAAGIPPGVVERTVREQPDACAVLGVHPTYYGTVGNTAHTASLAHAAGMPLLADEAHGCHFYFHQGFPAGALAAGADAVVQSMHKTGGSLTQSSLLHLKERSFLDGDRVSAAIKLIQTSSPSYLLAASLDAARRQLAVRGSDILERVLETAGQLRQDLSRIGGLEVLGPEHIDGEGVCGFDPARLVVRVSGLGLTGYQAADWLAKRGFYVEMGDPNNIVLVLGLGTEPEDCRRLSRALGDLAVREGRETAPAGADPVDMPPAGMLMGLREAWFAPSRPVRLDQAAGLVCSEWVTVYPPGIPVLVPGEEINSSVVNYLHRMKRSGASFQGPADPLLNRIRVVD